MTFLKHCMEDGLVHIPYDREFINELNVERFGLEITGRLKFSHPPGTHDDRLWASHSQCTMLDLNRQNTIPSPQ